MIETSTLHFNENTLKVKTATPKCELPEFASAKKSTLQNILNYSKSLQIKKSEMVGELEIVNA